MQEQRKRRRISLRAIILLVVPFPFVYNSLMFKFPFDDYLVVTIRQSSNQRATLSLTQQATEDNSETTQLLHNETSACLLVMDDNHFLIEWIAYHYHTTMLRNLIVTTDPRSLTSPAMILERWSNKMNISIWTEDFAYVTNKTEIEEAEAWVQIKFANDNPSQELIRHRARQRLFYFHCMQEHKRENRGLTLLLDTDEFVRVNYHAVQQLRSSLYEAPPIWKPGSVLSLINEELKLQLPSNISASSCIQIPRLRFGAAIDSSIQFPPGPFDARTLATLRWQHHAATHNYRENRISKTIVDLRKVKWDSLHPVESIHRPLSNCGRRKLHIRPSEQLLLIHHYLGSWEQYSFRNDARKGNERSESNYRKIAALDDEKSSEIVSWLGGFTQNVGLAEAQRLLSDVGKVPSRSL